LKTRIDSKERKCLVETFKKLSLSYIIYAALVWKCNFGTKSSLQLCSFAL